MENIWLGHSPYTALAYSACQVNEETKYTVSLETANTAEKKAFI